MKIVKLATVIGVLGIDKKLPPTKMQKRRLRKPNKLKIKMSVMPQ